MWAGVILFLVVLIIVLSFYIMYYYRYPNSVSIIQMSLPNFNLDILHDKQPVIIQEAVNDLLSIQNAWFKTNILKNNIFITPNSWYRNRFKFLIIQPEDNLDITVYPAGQPIESNIPKPNEEVITIQLSKKQIIIVPFHWFIIIDDENTNYNCFGCHDLITLFLV